MPAAVKLASSAPSSALMEVLAFRIWRSAAALCSSGVTTKLVAVRLLTVMSAVGATPPLFSRVVTRLSMGVTDEGAVRPAVAGDLERAAVAQDGLGREGGLAQEVPDDPPIIGFGLS